MITSRWLCAVLMLGLAGCARAPQEPASADVSPESVLLGKPYTGAAVATPRGADGKPNFTGYWKLLRDEGKPDGNLGKDELGFALPYSAAGKAALDRNVNHTIDPEARCLITGIPRLLTSVLPFEILHTPKRLGTFFMLGWHRWTWLDGRTAEQDPDPKYLGSAIGHWDGDTLVIESAGFKDSAEGQLWLDDNGNPQSARSTRRALDAARSASPEPLAHVHRSGVLLAAGDLRAALGCSRHPARRSRSFRASGIRPGSSRT